MVEYNKINVKLSDNQLKKLKTVVKNKTGTTLRIGLKIFNGNELLLTTRQKTKLTKVINESNNSFSKKYFSTIRNYSCSFSNWCRNSKKIHGSGNTNLIISNEEMNDIMKLFKLLKILLFLWKGVTKTIRNETKEQKGGFLSMLLGTLGASLLGNVLTIKGVVRAGTGKQWDF